MVEIEVKKGRRKGDYDIKCPRCGSSNIHIDKKGFSAGNALGGAILLGPLGALAGFGGRKDLVGTCLNCGKKFEVLKQIKKQWKERKRAGLV